MDVTKRRHREEGWTATRGSLLVDGSHAGQRQQNRCANSLLRPDIKAGSRTTRAIIPRATCSGYFPGRSARIMRGHSQHLKRVESAVLVALRPQGTLRSEPIRAVVQGRRETCPIGRRDTSYVSQEMRRRSQSHQVAGWNSRVR